MHLWHLGASSLSSEGRERTAPPIFLGNLLVTYMMVTLLVCVVLLLRSALLVIPTTTCIFGLLRAAERIGRYGNGFKSSAIRLGGDALVLSVSQDDGSMVAGVSPFGIFWAPRTSILLPPGLPRQAHRPAIPSPFSFGPDPSIALSGSCRVMPRDIPAFSLPYLSHPHLAATFLALSYNIARRHIPSYPRYAIP